MRNLTIKRTKSFVGCAAKMKVYIEDSMLNEITINNVPCRKIGELKNGEEKTFVIEEQAAKVFVIADKMSKDYCNEYYELTEGQEDIFLSGKNKFNPANGNAFRFDNNESEGISINRKRGTRKGLIILAAAIIVGAIVGYFSGSQLFSVWLSEQTSEPKIFNSNGMRITLTDDFKEMGVENYTVAYDSRNVAVLALEEKFSLAEGFENYSIEQYADLVIQNNGLSSVSLKTDGNLNFFEYEFKNPETQDVYRYFSYVYKTDDAFWLVQFATLNENVEDYAQQISKWAESVEFTD